MRLTSNILGLGLGSLYLISSVSITLNEALGLDGFSVTYLLICGVIFISFVLLNKNAWKINRRVFIFSAALLVVSLLNILFFPAVAVKNLLYVLFMVSVYVCSLNANVNKIISSMWLLGWVSYFLLILNYVVFVKVAGVSMVDFYNYMPFKKQELTSIFTVFSIIVLVKLVRDRSKFTLLFYFLFLSTLLFLALKTVVLVSLLCVVVVYSINNVKRLLLLSFLLFIVLIGLLNIDLTLFPETIQPFIDFFIKGEDLHREDLRRLDTFYIRQFIFVENLQEICSSFRGGLFGIGENVVSGVEFTSSVSEYEYTAPEFLESGVLYILVNFGFVGGMFFLWLFFLHFKALKDLFSKEFISNNGLLSLLVLGYLMANIFQDNVNSPFWFVLGVGFLALNDKDVNYE